jgi:hypothetical protein
MLKQQQQGTFCVAGVVPAFSSFSMVPFIHFSLSLSARRGEGTPHQSAAFDGMHEREKGDVPVMG